MIFILFQKLENRRYWNDKRVGDPVHIETDMLFKYVERIMESTDSGLTSDKLKAFGFLGGLYMKLDKNRGCATSFKRR
ncbi:riboflavin synthase subunit alpha [Staphylococcus gallinarum]|uniref:Riboflavin synthase subunit alpha n=1 Tax=Staphylococcus gallinarum TaxID=1293 RepID=A0A380FK10_STAGA|nr:riboflavin synthase subunit alpha [Staphylococcus gallinarum]